MEKKINLKWEKEIQTLQRENMKVTLITEQRAELDNSCIC